MSMAGSERVRLVVLGGPGVGKTAVLRRFLHDAFSERYRSTVEDLHAAEFLVGDATIKVDIVDTAGDQQFPAMRRLSVATAQGFLLVYAVSSAASFAAVRRCMDELREQRVDYQEVPVVVVGNKSDVAPARREVRLEDVSEWLHCELPRMRSKVVECSARENTGVRDVFRALLALWRPDDALRRRASAYVSQTSKGKARAESSSAESGPKPRSRSLIRRTSRKTKAAPRDPPDDCRPQ